jgi:hypothetical protein
MRPLYIVTEEVWSISSKTSERRLLSSSEHPLLSGAGILVANVYAKQRASEFQYSGAYDDGDQIYWWGRNEGDEVNRRFVIKPAPPSRPVFVDKDGQPRGRRSRGVPPITPAIEAPGAAERPPAQ